MRRLAIAMALLAMVACSGDDDSASAPSTTSTTVVDGDTVWLCHPDVDDACEHEMDATIVAADGSTTVERFEADPDAPIDCFYVYPTVSNDPGANSDLEPGAEETSTVRNQAARLGSACRVFAPMYRQATRTILLQDFGAFVRAMDDAYDDVLAAWNHYLAAENDGRGVILAGHSQGASHVLRLLREEINPDAEQRARLVSAIVAGASAHASDLPNVPPCEDAHQTGCIITWSTFRDTAPPPASAFFGRPKGSEPALCTNPASLAGGSGGLHPYFPSSLPVGADVDTPFVSLPGLVTAECREVNGINHLAITVHPDDGPRIDDVRGDLNPEWGMHIIDVNVAMGDLVTIADAQAQAYSDG